MATHCSSLCGWYIGLSFNILLTGSWPFFVGFLGVWLNSPSFLFLLNVTWSFSMGFFTVLYDILHMGLLPFRKPELGILCLVLQVPKVHSIIVSWYAFMGGLYVPFINLLVFLGISGVNST